MTPTDPHERVLAALRTLRAPLITEETDLHAIVRGCLRSAGIAYRKEAPLGGRDHIEILADGGVGVECKKGRPNATDLVEQITRYCGSRRIRSIVVVTPWKRHLPAVGEIGGKRVSLISLNELWGVAV